MFLLAVFHTYSLTKRLYFYRTDMLKKLNTVHFLHVFLVRTKCLSNFAR